MLAPEQDFTGELNIERHWSDGRVRLTLFEERTNNAIISQTNTVTSANNTQVMATTFSNVAAIRMQGVELSAEKDNVLFKGLQMFGSVTYVDSRILSDPNWAGTDPLTNVPDTVVGKRVPYVPDWRARLGVTYRPNDNWAFTVAARYKRQAIFDARQHRRRLPRLRGLRQLHRRGHEGALQRDEEFLVRLRHR